VVNSCVFFGGGHTVTSGGVEKRGRKRREKDGEKYNYGDRVGEGRNDLRGGRDVGWAAIHENFFFHVVFVWCGCLNLRYSCWFGGSSVMA
jgi:hypothetical protein